MKEKVLILYLVAFALLYLAYEMFHPFLPAIFWAVVFSLVFYPLYNYLSKKIKSNDIAALVIVIICFLLFAGPLSYLSYLLVNEIKEIVKSSSDRTISSVLFENSRISPLIEKLARMLGTTVSGIYATLYDFAGNLKKSILRIVNVNAFVVFHAIVDYFIMLFTIFFLLRDQHIFIERLYRLLPLEGTQKDYLIARIKEVVISTVYGGVLIALVHGIVGGTAFYFLGVPSPILLGFAMSVLSFVPVFGAFTVWGPVAAYLFISGDILKGFIMTATGVIVIAGVIDHVLKPKIIGERTKIHTLLIFFSVLGGIHLFGIMGFIAGPLLIAVLMLVLEIIEQRLAEA